MSALNITIKSTYQGLDRPSVTSTTKNFPLGTMVEGVDNDTDGAVTLVYGKLGVTATGGDWCLFQGWDSGKKLARDDIGDVGIACTDFAANEYGWFVVRGTVKAQSGSGAADTWVYPTTTAGDVNATASAGDRVKGARRVTATDTGFANYQINFPLADDGAAA